MDLLSGLAQPANEFTKSDRGKAVTIYKVQGIGLDKAVIDLGNVIFDHGQAYVALSKVRRLDGVLRQACWLVCSKPSFDKNKSCVHDEYARLARCPIS